MNQYEYYRDIQLSLTGSAKCVIVEGSPSDTFTPGNEYEFFENIQLTEEGYLKLYVQSTTPTPPTPTPTITTTPTPTPTITPTPTPTTPVGKLVTVELLATDTDTQSVYEFTGIDFAISSGLVTVAISSPSDLDITSITLSGYSMNLAIEQFSYGYNGIYYLELPMGFSIATLRIALSSPANGIGVQVLRLNNNIYSYPISTYSLTGSTPLNTVTPNTISTDRIIYAAGGYGCNSFICDHDSNIYAPACFGTPQYRFTSGTNNSSFTSTTWANTVFRPDGDTNINYISAVFR